MYHDSVQQIQSGYYYYETTKSQKSLIFDHSQVMNEWNFTVTTSQKKTKKQVASALCSDSAPLLRTFQQWRQGDTVKQIIQSDRIKHTCIQSAHILSWWGTSKMRGSEDEAPRDKRHCWRFRHASTVWTLYLCKHQEDIVSLAFTPLEPLDQMCCV